MKISDKSCADWELDVIYDYINYLFFHKQFYVVDCIFQGLILNLDKLTKDEILGYLTATFCAKSKLNNRAYFLANVRKFFHEEELTGLE